MRDDCSRIPERPTTFRWRTIADITLLHVTLAANSFPFSGSCVVVHVTERTPIPAATAT